MKVETVRGKIQSVSKIKQNMASNFLWNIYKCLFSVSFRKNFKSFVKKKKYSSARSQNLFDNSFFEVL